MMMNYKTVKAICIEGHTLIGSYGDFPRSSGNCFTVKGKNGKNYRIVNFIYENLMELEKQGLTWPVEIEVLEENIAVINDPRVADRWYLSKFCEVCCPESLLPVPQLLQHKRMELRGERRTKDGWTTLFAQNPKFK